MSILEPFKVFMDSEAFINKVNKIVDTTTDADATNMRLRRKEWSLFLSEIFPIKTLLETKRNRWAGIKIKMFLDKAASPDAEIEGLQNIKYLEITEVGFDTYELYSMTRLNKCHYSLPSNPYRKIKNVDEKVNSNKPNAKVYSDTERYENSIRAISTRINDKKEKYASASNNKTALLVSFDDYGRLGRADDNDDFRNLLKESKIEKGPFVNIFVVGSGKNSLYLEL